MRDPLVALFGVAFRDAPAPRSVIVHEPQPLDLRFTALATAFGARKTRLSLAGVAVNADRSSILIFALSRQGDKSHTCRENELFRA
jgi:hypothetical protein